MLKKLLTKIFPSEYRAFVRYPIANMSQCFISSNKVGNGVAVYMGDISEAGFSFFFKSPWFEISDPVTILLVHNSQSVEMKGQIVSQRILYPQGSDDLNLALYRYSVQFSDRLAAEWIERFGRLDGKRDLRSGSL